MLPESHRKLLWSGRPFDADGFRFCGACEERISDGRSEKWNELFNLGVTIIACAEAPEYEPDPDFIDSDGFCWVGGIPDAVNMVRRARIAIAKFSIGRW